MAAATVILYLVEGSIGLPVFAKGGGFAYLMGPTGGYLIGFILSAYFAGIIKIKNDPLVVFFSFTTFCECSLYIWIIRVVELHGFG